MVAGRQVFRLPRIPVAHYSLKQRPSFHRSRARGLMQVSVRLRATNSEISTASCESMPLILLAYAVREGVNISYAMAVELDGDYRRCQTTLNQRRLRHAWQRH